MVKYIYMKGVKKLGTSSSPIFTAFKNMEEVQNEVRAMALKEFENCVSDALNFTPAFKYVGMKMIEFAMREPKLFQLTWLHTFSICALVANKVCHFSMAEISEILSASFQGSLMLIKSGTFQTIPVNKQEKP